MKRLPEWEIFRKRDLFFRFFIVVFSVSAAAVASVWFCRLFHLAANAYVGQDAEFWYPRLFSDFTQVAYYSVRRDAYLLEGGSSYSAIALLFMLPFALIFRQDLAATEYSAVWVEPNMQILASWRFWLAFALYQAFAYLLLYLLSRKLLPGRGGGLFACFAASAGTIYTFLRGNTLLVMLSLVLLFLLWYKSERAWKREVALLAFAAAGAMKLYPLFFVAFLLHDRKWLSAVRGMLYFLLLYFLPVLFYEGGLIAYLDNLSAFVGGENHMGDVSNIAIASVLYKIFGLFFTEIPGWAEWLCVGAGGLFLLFAASAAVVTDSPLRRGLLSLCAVTLVPPVSYFYVVIFALIPAAEYLKNYEERTPRENSRFVLIFLAFGFYPIYAAYCFIVASALLIFLGVACVVKTFREREFANYFSQLFKKIRKDEENA